MGRTPRLVNPDDGPLQAFAHDLRQLREKAGNPTYRALAKTAGFSASTLGEAAGGVRRPSLDVTLAFVGACGGDLEAWQERWHAMDRQLAAEQIRQDSQAEQSAQDSQGGPGEPDASTDAPASAPTTAPTTVPMIAPAATVSVTTPTAAFDLADALTPPPPAESHPALSQPAPAQSGTSRRRVRHALVAAAALTAISVLAFIGVRGNPGSADASTGKAGKNAGAFATPSCVIPGPKGLFSGSTRGTGARIRAGASMVDNVVRTVPAYCQLQFDGYCLGDVVGDAYGGVPDMRWFEVSGGGVVASAVIHGNPPTGLKPSACPDSVPEPSSIALSAADSKDSSGEFELHATGVHVWIVGFATVPDDRTGGDPVPASAKWQQIGMVGSSSTGFTLAWSARASAATQAPGQGTPGSTTAGRVPIVAVACYGGQGPTDVMDPRSVSVTNPTDTTPLTLTPAQRAAAADAACAYPRP
jgi:hypothetical protein